MSVTLKIYLSLHPLKPTEGRTKCKLPSGRDESSKPGASVAIH